MVYWVGHFAAPFHDAFNALWLQIANGVIYSFWPPRITPGGITATERRSERGRSASTSSPKRPKLPITMKQADLQELWVTSFLTFPLGAGFLMAALHPEKRALHDLIAGRFRFLKKIV